MLAEGKVTDINEYANQKEPALVMEELEGDMMLEEGFEPIGIEGAVKEDQPEEK